MAKADPNNDRLFLSRLSKTYQCRTGDNIMLDCYVRHQRIKSIVWYAKDELVDARGVRAWHEYNPKTGQCILFLRSLFKCDEGSYYCEATSLDDVVETLEITLIINSRDRSWTKVPMLYMAGHVVPGSVKQLLSSYTK